MLAVATVRGPLEAHVRADDRWRRTLHEHGALLLRSATHPDADPLAFSRFGDALGWTPFDGAESAAPRTRVAPRVWTANEAPPSEAIPFHHEMAQCATAPRHLAFFCQVAPAAGGATPLVDSAAVARAVAERFPASFAEVARRGVRYRRVLPSATDPRSPIGRSWAESLGVRDRVAAERALAARGASWSWRANGDLETLTAPRAAVRVNDRGKRVFFNSVVAARAGWRDARNDPATAVVFGDDASRLTDGVAAMFDYAERYMGRHAVRVAWRVGDVLLVDNHQMLHARDAFLPPRRVLASLWA